MSGENYKRKIWMWKVGPDSDSYFFSFSSRFGHFFVLLVLLVVQTMEEKNEKKDIESGVGLHILLFPFHTIKIWRPNPSLLFYFFITASNILMCEEMEKGMWMTGHRVLPTASLIVRSKPTVGHK